MIPFDTLGTVKPLLLSTPPKWSPRNPEYEQYAFQSLSHKSTSKIWTVA
jgi:hypothetical protein